MNKNAKKWVKALKSGEYEQGKDCLCDLGEKYDYFCCLGVACDLYQSETGKLNVEIENYNKVSMMYDGMMAMLPEEVCDWLGLRSKYGTYDETSLADDNDKGKTFLKIADIIKSEPEGLFKE